MSSSRSPIRRIPSTAPWVVLAFAISGCAPFRAGMPADAAARSQSSVASQGTGAVIAREARTLLGTPYRYGGSEPATGFDCSGLVSYVHSREGIVVPRTASTQFAAARRVALGELRPGDLVFFRLVPHSREVTHVGIYVGNGRFVHAPQSGRNVVEASLDDGYYRERFAGAGRFYDEGSGEGPRIQSSAR